MDLTEAQNLAFELMQEYRLFDEGWVFAFDRGVRRFGSTQGIPGTRGGKITLSRHLTAMHDRPQVENTIRHEVAHALAGVEAHHGPEWRRMCAVVGIEPKRCHSAETPPAPYVLACGDGCEVKRYRRTNSRYICRRHGERMQLLRVEELER